jgi:hypothetical protein
VCHDAGTHRVQFDVPVTGQEVATVLHQAGSKAAFPKRAATLVGAVDILHVALAQMFHEQSRAMLCGGCEQQVYVICHQAPGVKAALVFGGLFCGDFQEILVVTVLNCTIV